MEVYDPTRLVTSLEWLVDHVNAEVEDTGRRALILDSETIRGREYFRIESVETGLSAHFVFDGGYLVAGPTTALIDRTLQNRDMGIRLVDSPAFLDQLPQDSQVDFSGVFYQNLGPIIGPLSRTVGGAMNLSDEDRQMLDALALDSKPMVALLYGEEDRIILSSSSEGGLLSSSLDSLTGFGSLLGMQQSVSRAVSGIRSEKARVDVKQEVPIE